MGSRMARDAGIMAFDPPGGIARGLERARSACQSRGVRLTDQRRQVLEILLASRSALGAYDILERMAPNRRRVAPMTVYRALDFLMTVGLVHRLASLNAFAVCRGPADGHCCQFLICQQCRSVVELADTGVDAALGAAVDRIGFTAVERFVEVLGDCSACRDAGRG